MSRKVLKISISLLFLAVAAVAAVLSIKNFMPDLFDQVKYGVKNIDGVKYIAGEPTHKTPAFKKDKQEQEPRVTPNYQEGKKYGVAPIKRPPYREQGEKYGVAPIRKVEKENLLKNQIRDVKEYGGTTNMLPNNKPGAGKYGVAPIEK